MKLGNVVLVALGGVLVYLWAKNRKSIEKNNSPEKSVLTKKSILDKREPVLLTPVEIDLPAKKFSNEELLKLMQEQDRRNAELGIDNLTNQILFQKF
jgi:hypothetical protein